MTPGSKRRHNKEMNTKPLSYLLTFLLGASLWRVVGFFVFQYGRGLESQATWPMARATVSAAVSIAVISSIGLLYLWLVGIPKLHPIFRSIVSHISVSVFVLSLWRAYAFASGAISPFNFANRVSVIVTTMFISACVIVILALYKEEPK